MPPSDSFIIVEGLTTVPSHFAPKETMDRVETEIGERGMNVFARIDHAAGAAKVGLTLRPTELIIFGNGGRHAGYAVEPNRWDRFAAKGARMAGRRRQDIDFI